MRQLKGARARAFSILQMLLFAGAMRAASLDVITVDSRGQPVSGVQLQLRIGPDVRYTAQTGADGHARFQNLKPAGYDLRTIGSDFEPAEKDLDLTLAGELTVRLTLLPAPAHHDSIDVKGDL
ncbi:MAG: carboxypeptidase-like regulatory domain-containing protein, partial [Acidobacteriota bacterium]